MPFSYLDFETIAYAIPKYNGTRPYQQLPFQFSCHVQARPNGIPDHLEYLHDSETDPREAIAKALVSMVPKTGSVIAYNMAFERQVLLALAKQFPKYRGALEGIAQCLVDPLPVIRAHVYYPAFCGSFSIKAVAPAPRVTKAWQWQWQTAQGRRQHFWK